MSTTSKNKHSTTKEVAKQNSSATRSKSRQDVVKSKPWIKIVDLPQKNYK